MWNISTSDCFIASKKCMCALRMCTSAFAVHCKPILNVDHFSHERSMPHKHLCMWTLICWLANSDTIINSIWMCFKEILSQTNNQYPCAMHVCPRDIALYFLKQQNNTTTPPLTLNMMNLIEEKDGSLCEENVTEQCDAHQPIDSWLI